MLYQEVTVGIYPEGELNNILIVPDGIEYHLFLTGSNHKYQAGQNTLNLGSLVMLNGSWTYQGDKLSVQSQTELANYIMCYPNAEPNQAAIL